MAYYALIHYLLWAGLFLTIISNIRQNKRLIKERRQDVKEYNEATSKMMDQMTDTNSWLRGRLIESFDKIEELEKALREDQQRQH